VAVVNGYCTTQDLRDQLGDGGSNLSTSLLERAINAASRAVDDHCGRGIDGGPGQFWQDSAPTTRTYVVTNPRAVRVDDISTRTGLVVKTGSDGVNFPTTLVTGTDFFLEPRNADAAGASANPYAFWILRAVGVLFFPSVFPNLPTVQVTARFGWSAVPYEVTEATILKAASLFKRKDAPFGIAGFNEFGAVRITRQDADVLELLSGFTRPMYA
jgi:hypothetical protein